MFGSSWGDPNSQTENIGDDPVKASYYGIKNLKIVAQNLAEWTNESNKDYSDLEELYTELLGVYRRYIFHVIGIIGGVNQTLINTNQSESFTYKNVDKQKQIRALNFLDSELWNSPIWLLDKSIISQINNYDGLYQVESIHDRSINSLLSINRLNRMLSSNSTLVGEGLNFHELIDILFKSIFEKINPVKDIDRNLQISFTKKIISLIQEEDLKDPIKSKALSMKDHINKLSKRKIKSNSNKIIKDHFRYIFFLTSEEN
jgi:hypothetical protein